MPVRACSRCMHLKDAAHGDRPLHNGVWAAACGVLASAAIVLGVGAALQSDWARVAAWAGCAAIAIAAIIFRRTLPPFFGFLLTLATMVNAAGYVLNLWHERTMFDEAVHGFAFFAGMSSAGWLILQHKPGLTGLYWKAALAAVVAGLAWEAFEAAIGIIGDMRDTLVDLVMDLIGSLAAAALLRKLVAREERPAATSRAGAS